MRILLLTHSFNSLSQRLYVELLGLGHELSVEFDINDDVTAEAVAWYEPQLVIAPFLKRAIPERIWSHHTCLIVHPGIVGDRGPSALDGAILVGERRWGVTVLQATGVMDAGPVWASAEFAMRPASKSSLYRNEVTEAAVEAVLKAVERYAGGTFKPRPLDYNDPGVRGRLRPAVKQSERAIDWARDDTATVLRKIRSADGHPGVRDEIDGRSFYLFNGVAEDRIRGEPGQLLGRRDGAVCRATVDGAIWVTHLKPDLPRETERAYKLPAVIALGAAAGTLPEIPVSLLRDPERQTLQEIAFEVRDGVGYLHFDFYNGAMATSHCERLQAAFEEVVASGVRVLVLCGGQDFWCNGIHLNMIEAAESPADESWRNINAMDDLCRSIVLADKVLTVAALRGNAGAGGVFLSLAADRVLCRSGVVLNPHYKNMGNLYGSEYWTYLLPARVGEERAQALMSTRLPLGAREAHRYGLVDTLIEATPAAFLDEAHRFAREMAADGAFERALAAKRERRLRDEADRPLAEYRAQELERMRLNFYGFDPSYHVARYAFVHKRPLSRTPLHLAKHRRRVAPEPSPVIS